MVDSSENAKIDSFLSALEKKHNISIIFTCESGSRAHGTFTNQSDHDLKGFYLSKSYKNNKEKYGKLIKETNTKFTGFSIPLDIEFMDLKQFFEELEQQNEVQLRWLFTTVVYREKYPEIRKTILEETSPPREEIMKRLNKDMDKYNLKGTREAGKAVNMVVDSMLLLSIQK
jgi:predicted nucleotidyltransferase